MLTGMKSATQSVTIMSIVASLVFLLLGNLGVAIAEPDQRAIVESLALIASAAAQLLAIWGRYRAKKVIATGGQSGSGPGGGAFALVLVLLLAVPMANCAPVGGATDGVGRSTLVDDKALLALETSFHIAVTVVEQAVDTGELKGADASKARSALRSAYKALRLARSAYEVGDAGSFATQSVAVLGFLGAAQQVYRDIDKGDIA